MRYIFTLLAGKPNCGVRFVKSLQFSMKMQNKKLNLSPFGKNVAKIERDEMSSFLEQLSSGSGRGLNPFNSMRTPVRCDIGFTFLKTLILGSRGIQNFRQSFCKSSNNLQSEIFLFMGFAKA